MTPLAFFLGLGSGSILGAFGLLLYQMRADAVRCRQAKADQITMARAIDRAAKRSLAVRAARARLGRDVPGSWGISTEGKSLFEDLWDDTESEPWR